ncbi:MAG: DNA mismatch repair endonuclease MutL [Roseivirga sp.]
MSDLIRLLPDTLANQIAAGEVVQRPASVVKELIENAIDAQSSTIKVVIKDAGKTLIQVIDNGSGMSEVDARMSLEKHATSKISTTEDLFNIQTMGFRGEALASIGAVAQLEMETCRQKEEIGTKIIVEGATVKAQEPVSTAKGTKISVKNLFFNVPARRNFLKSNPIETKHIIDEFQRAALARPDIAFSLYQNEAETYQLPATKLSHRIVHLLGENHKQQLIPCQEETALLKIKGYIGKPAHARKTRGDQFFFVNQRFIKSAYLHHAVKSAFEGLLPSDAFPFYVLFIDIAPARIDINVHPTKTEIKFEDERMVYSVLIAAIKQALAVHHVTPSLDFEQNTNFNPFSTPPTMPTQQRSGIDERNYAQFRGTSTAKTDAKDWEKLFQNLTQEAPEAKAEPTTTRQLSSATEAATPPQARLDPMAEGTAKMQLHARYLLAQVKSGILLIDQQAAHERILYERYVQSSAHQTGHAQQLLFPLHVALNPADLVLVKDCEAEMRALGFVLESFGKDSLIVSGCPPEAAVHDLKQLLEGLIEQFKWNKTRLSLTKQENLARSLAKRACMQSGKRLRKEEIDALVDQLFACTHPNYTPDGRKTFVMITLKDIEGIFLA